MKQCQKLIYPHVTEDDIEFAYKHAGGVARLAFDNNLLAENMDSMKERANDVRLKNLQRAVNACMSSILSTKAVGDRLLSIHPRDGYDVVWASTDAKDMAMATLNEKQVNMAEAFMLSNVLSGAETGILFEHLAHHYLREEHDDLRRYISGGDDVDTFEFSFNSKEDFEGTRVLTPTALRKNRSYKSTKENFKAIDALGECNDVLYLFQMKISGAKFPVPLLTNDKLLAKWGKPRGKPRIENTWGQSGGYRKCIYVYVVLNVGSEGSENFYKVVEKAKKHI